MKGYWGTWISGKAPPSSKSCRLKQKKTHDSKFHTDLNAVGSIPQSFQCHGGSN